MALAIGALEGASSTAYAQHGAAQQGPSASLTLSASLTGDAKVAYEAGRLLFGDGDYAGAEIKFQAAYEASHDARLLWNMAACEKSQRHYARTEQLVRDYIDKGGALLTDQDRADAKSLLETIDSFTVKLTINVSEPDAEVLVDDVPVGRTPLSKPIIVDIGTRKIVVRKDGFKESEQQTPVGGAATAKIDVKLTPQTHEGTLHITVAAAAGPGTEILIDGARVGAAGHYDGKIRSGGHTLRVTADGMRPYQTEIVVSDDESRAIDIPALEKGAPPPTPKLWAPSAETAFSLATGGVLHGGGAAVFDMRFEFGWKPGWPTEIAVFTDLGTLDPSQNCGSTTFHGPTATSATDIAARYAFQSCYMTRFGLLFGLHFTPKSKLDVYASLEVGTHGVVAEYKSFDPLTRQVVSGWAVLYGLLDVGGRLGVDYHAFLRQPPREKKQSAAARWSVGAFASFVGTVAGGEGNGNHNCNSNATPCNNNNNHGGPNQSFPWLLLFGARTSLTF